MAHSNRQKLRDARGGKTRNQARKAQQQSNSSSSDRMANTLKWMADNEEKRKQAAAGKGAPKTEAKVVRYEKSVNATNRRKSALKRLEERKVLISSRMKEVSKEESTERLIEDFKRQIIRMDKEINTLKSRL